jgi:NADP-dependent 3-hydroxy acid dehydrogenase YdfG
MVDTDFADTALGKEKGQAARATLPCLKAQDVADAVVYALSAPATVQVSQTQTCLIVKLIKFRFPV